MRNINIIFTHRNHDYITIKLNVPQVNIISIKKMYNNNVVINMKMSLPLRILKKIIESLF